MKQTRQLSRLVPIVTLVIWLAGTALADQSSIKLRSGKEVKVVKVGPVYGQGMKKLAVELQYETELKVSDLAALREEANQVVEKRPAGVITKSEGYNFVFEKRADGRWHCLDDK